MYVQSLIAPLFLDGGGHQMILININFEKLMSVIEYKKSFRLTWNVLTFKNSFGWYS